MRWKVNALEFVKNEITIEELNYYEECLNKLGYKKVFDTQKSDYHYRKVGTDLIVQLQEIEKIGLMVYYDNTEYYNLPLKKQRKKLIDELNSFGFDFKDNELGIDKLRTLHYGKEMYCENQNV